MSLDARSKERLEALGRTLPKKLPLPNAPKGKPGEATGTAGTTGESRHPLEKEQDPSELFRVLMKASPDGTVPPHLLERLRELEGAAALPPAHAPTTASGPTARSRGAKPSSRSGRVESRGKEEQDLYSAFAQLLLEDDDA